jgi:hypothetical protein
MMANDAQCPPAVEPIGYNHDTLDVSLAGKHSNFPSVFPRASGRQQVDGFTRYLVLLVCQARKVVMVGGLGGEWRFFPPGVPEFCGYSPLEKSYSRARTASGTAQDHNGIRSFCGESRNHKPGANEGKKPQAYNTGEQGDSEKCPAP